MPIIERARLAEKPRRSANPAHLATGFGASGPATFDPAAAASKAGGASRTTVAPAVWMRRISLRIPF